MYFKGNFQESQREKYTTQDDGVSWLRWLYGCMVARLENNLHNLSHPSTISRTTQDYGTPVKGFLLLRQVSLAAKLFTHQIPGENVEKGGKKYILRVACPR